MISILTNLKLSICTKLSDSTSTSKKIFPRQRQRKMPMIFSNRLQFATNIQLTSTNGSSHLVNSMYVTQTSSTNFWRTMMLRQLYRVNSKISTFDSSILLDNIIIIMIRLAALVRRAVYPGCDAVRGPKKKKGESEAKIQSTDIINIFKERADPEIQDIRNYPVYVQEQARRIFGVHDFYLAISHNKQTELPGRANLKGYLKAWKRQRTKAFGQFKHLDRNPDILSQNDIHHRRASYDLAAEGRALLQEKLRLEQQAAAQEGDDE